MSQAPELADQVLVILKRAWPGEVQKDDLVEQAGMSPGDLSRCLAYLESEGELDLTAEEYRWNNPEDGDGGREALTESEDEGEEEPIPASRLDLPDHSGRTARVTLELTGSFTPARGQSDEGNLRQAQYIAEKVGNVLGQMMPGLGANLEVRKLEVFDSPRVLFDAEAEAEVEVEEPGEEG